MSKKEIHCAGCNVSSFETFNSGTQGYGICYLSNHNKAISPLTIKTTRYLITQLNESSNNVESVTTQASVDILFVMTKDGFCYEVKGLEVSKEEIVSSM